MIKTYKYIYWFDDVDFMIGRRNFVTVEELIYKFFFMDRQ